MTLAQHITALIIILREAQDDADKLESGKRGYKPAGTRLRREAQIVARECDKLRKTVTQIKKETAESKAKG